MDDMESDDVAAAMGFASFGGTKKRKFDQTKSPKANTGASGANKTQLGERHKNENGGTDFKETSSNAAEPEDHSRSPGAQEVPTEKKSRQKQKQKKKKEPVTAGLAAFLARGKALPDRSANTAQGGHEGQTVLPHPHSESQPHAPAQPQAHHDHSRMVSFGGQPLSQVDLTALRHGVPDENGDKAYFLPSFVEDPWEKSMKGRK